MKKRIICAALSALMLTALIPSALADGGETTQILYAWGDNVFGQLGNSNKDTISSICPSGESFVDVEAGGNHALGVDKDGELWAWGCGLSGQLGNNGKESISAPVYVMSGVAAIAAGGDHSLAITNDGALWAWGGNQYGQLGNGVKEDSSVPIKIMDGVAAVAAGDKHSVALKADGSVWAWGRNNQGQLGNGNRQDSSVPVCVYDGGVTAVSAGVNHCLALLEDGTLWAWGGNTYGQLGVGNKQNSTSPLYVMSYVTQFDAGGNCSAAITTLGQLWTWGCDLYGELGDGSKIDRSKPGLLMENAARVSVGGTHSVYSVEAVRVPAENQDNYQVRSEIFRNNDGSHMLAVKTDGSLWAWGCDNSGQLGDSKKQDTSTPIEVGGDKLIIDFSAGGNFSLVLTTEEKQEAPAPQPEETRVRTGALYTMNGQPVALSTYEINDYNYIKLRDLAAVAAATGAKFQVSWDSAAYAVTLTRGADYTPVGGELAPAGGAERAIVPATAALMLDGSPAALTGYEIGGNNYYRLREVCALLGISVGYDAASNTVMLSA